MDTTFNIHRFGKLFCNEYKLNLKKLIFLLGALLGIPVLYFGFFFSMNESVQINSTITFFFLAILGSQGQITNIHFSEFSSRSHTLSYLMIPGSKLEKFASKFVCCLIVPPILFALYFCFVVKLNMVYNTWVTDAFNLNHDILRDEKQLDYFFNNVPVLLMFYAICFLSAVSFLCGSLTFKKRALLKTFLGVITFVIVSGFVLWVFYYMVSGHTTNMLFPYVFIAEKGVRGYAFMVSWEYYLHFLVSFLALYLIVVSWFKFNEKTV